MFFDKEKRLIEYAEDEARSLAHFQIECTDALEKSSNTFLNILLGGAGGGLALAISLFDKGADEWLVIGAFCTSIYLFVLCGILTIKCLWSQDIYPPANEPKNIFNDNTKGLRLCDVKTYNLESRQFCIQKNRERNNRVGMWLNRVRAMAAMTPLVMVSCFLLF